MRNRAALIVLFASSLLSPAVPAAEPAAPTPRESAARELYLAMGGLKTAENAEDVMIAAVHGNPQLLPYEDVFRAWYRATMAKAGLEPKIVALYAATFTEAELKDLTAFYRSPLGRKALSKVPDLMKRGLEIGEQAAKENQPELERMLEARRKELEKVDRAKTPTPAPTATPGPRR